MVDNSKTPSIGFSEHTAERTSFDNWEQVNRTHQKVPNGNQLGKFIVAASCIPLCGESPSWVALRRTNIKDQQTEMTSSMGSLQWPSRNQRSWGSQLEVGSRKPRVETPSLSAPDFPGLPQAQLYYVTPQAILVLCEKQQKPWLGMAHLPAVLKEWVSSALGYLLFSFLPVETWPRAGILKEKGEGPPHSQSPPSSSLWEFTNFTCTVSSLYK